MLNKLINRILLIVLVITVLFPIISYSQQYAGSANIPYALTQEYTDPVLGNTYEPDYYSVNPDTIVTLETFESAFPAADGQWIPVDPSQVDPQGVSNTDDPVFDNNINTSYIWRPNNVEPDWNPYTNGYWQFTDAGWMWVSNYDWDATYHYGRWWYSDQWGWVWSPGYQWAPSWVTWRDNDECAGWYPISPRCTWDEERHCYNVNNYHFRENNWTFVEYQHFHNVVITPHNTINPTENHHLITKTNIVNDVKIDKHRVINKGPEVTKVEKVTGKKIASINIENVKKVPVISKANDTKKVNDKITEDAKVNVQNANDVKVNISVKGIDTKSNTTDSKTKQLNNTGSVRSTAKDNGSGLVTSKPNDTRSTQPKADTKKTGVNSQEYTVKQKVTSKPDNNVKQNNQNTYVPPVKHDNYVPPVKHDTNVPPVKNNSGNNHTQNVMPKSQPKSEPKTESPKVEKKQEKSQKN